MASTSPPYYILVSHSPLQNDTQSVTPRSLIHPVIQYHYADDSPLSLLPESPNEYVLVLDYESTAAAPPGGRSLSKGLAVTGLKVTDAPGAGVADDEAKKNDKMYILETVVAAEDKAQDDSHQDQLERDPMLALTRFKEINRILHRAIDYPDLSAMPTPTPQVASLKIR